MAEGDEKTEGDLDLTKVDPANLPHSIVSKTPAFEGMVREAQALRTGNAALAERNAALEEQLAAEPNPEPGEEVEPGDYVTEERLKALIEENAQKVKAAAASANKEAAVEMQNKTLAKLLETKGLGKAPEGLDAQTVLRDGMRWLQQNKPHIYKAVFATNDAEEMYNAALRNVPAFIEKLDSQKHGEFLAKFNRTEIPGATGTLTQDEESQLAKMIDLPEDQLLAELAAEADMPDE